MNKTAAALVTLAATIALAGPSSAEEPVIISDPIPTDCTPAMTWECLLSHIPNSSLTPLESALVQENRTLRDQNAAQQRKIARLEARVARLRERLAASQG